MPYADEVAEACPSPDAESGSAAGRLVLPADCVGVLFEHVNVEQHGVAVRSTEQSDLGFPTWEASPRALLARALFYLWAVDAGRIEDLEDVGMMHLGLIEDLKRHRSSGPVRLAAYDYLANSIDRIELGSAGDRTARARYPSSKTGVVELYLDRGQGDAASLAGTLFHEARHRWGPGHVRCGDLPIDSVYPGEPLSSDSSCDRDLEGSFGFEAGWLWQIANHGGWEHEDDAWLIYRRIVAPRGDE